MHKRAKGSWLGHRCRERDKHNSSDEGNQMRAVLMGTTAVALIGATAAPADAAEWTVRVGGYMEQYVGYADVDAPVSGEFDGIDSKQDNEIHFLPKITLDNGIEIGADIQREGNTSGDTIDESFMRIKGSFGELNLGNENSAGYKMTYAAPDVTFLNVNSGSLTFFVPWSGTLAGVGLGNDTFRRTLGTSFIEVGGNNDSQRFTYFTPRFAGLQLGASYARDGRQDSNAQLDVDAANVNAGNALADVHDIFDFGANYVNSFGGFDVAVSGRYGFGDRNTGGTAEIWSAGINLGYAGFKIGGSYADADADHAQMEGEFWDVGISYESGPWGFSFTHSRGENVDNENAALGADEELQQYLLGISYALAKGVALNAYGAYVDFDEDLSDGGVGNGDDLDAWVVGTGIKISF